jgi:hypothetical protein
VDASRSLLLLETTAGTAPRVERFLSKELRVNREVPAAFRKVLVIRAGIRLTNWVWTRLAVSALNAFATRFACLISTKNLADRACSVSSNFLGCVLTHARVVVTLEAFTFV